MSRGKWLALAAALLGWMFDGLEQGLFPLAARPALQELLGRSGTDEKQIGLWFSVATAGFLVGAATGGVLFGWLGDRVGRVRAMTLSVVTYALFSGLCGFAQTPQQVAGLRFCSALGMGGEWALGVALVMEIWPEGSRALLAGLIGAAANVGFLFIALIGRALATWIGPIEAFLTRIGFSDQAVHFLAGNSAWRLLMFFGALPAVLMFLLNLFVPESGRWQEEHKRGRTSHWATRDLLGVLVGAAGAGLIVYVWAAQAPWPLRLPGTAIGLLVAALGYTYPVLRYLQRAGAHAGEARGTALPTLGRMLLGACLGGVALSVTWGAAQWIPTWADFLTHSRPGVRADTQIAGALGAILGTMVGATVGGRLRRRATYFALCLAALGASLLLYKGITSYGAAFLLATFLVGVTTASFYGWLPLYLPELFRTGVRATGQGFSYNFGRILAAIVGLQTANLMSTVFDNDYPKALSVVSLVYVAGMVLIWLAPETYGRPLPE